MAASWQHVPSAYELLRASQLQHIEMYTSTSVQVCRIQNKRVLQAFRTYCVQGVMLPACGSAYICAHRCITYVYIRQTHSSHRRTCQRSVLLKLTS